MTELWYPLALKADGRALFLLWASDDQGLDRVLADAGRVVSLAEEGAARHYAHGQHLALAPQEELVLHDLDSAVRWLQAGGEPDCGLLLTIWNLAGDVARGLSEPFEDRGEVLDHVYDKLFLGSNLPSVTPPGERYQPQWPQEELGLLRATIKTAADLIRSRVIAVGP
ncbi:MAG: hypothetical protein ACRDOI_42890 [Trebonia sp.]